MKGLVTRHITLINDTWDKTGPEIVNKFAVERIFHKGQIMILVSSNFSEIDGGEPSEYGVVFQGKDRSEAECAEREIISRLCRDHSCAVVHSYWETATGVVVGRRTR